MFPILISWHERIMHKRSATDVDLRNVNHHNRSHSDLDFKKAQHNTFHFHNQNQPNNDVPIKVKEPEITQDSLDKLEAKVHVFHLKEHSLNH